MPAAAIHRARAARCRSVSRVDRQLARLRHEVALRAGGDLWCALDARGAPAKNGAAIAVARFRVAPERAHFSDGIANLALWVDGFVGRDGNPGGGPFEAPPGVAHQDSISFPDQPDQTANSTTGRDAILPPSHAPRHPIGSAATTGRPRSDPVRRAPAECASCR